MILVLGVWAFVCALLINSAAVSLENIARRHQLAVLQRSSRPRRLVAATASLALAGRAGGPASPRPAPDGPRLAPPRLPALLALEVPTTPTRSPADRPQDPQADSKDGPRKPHLGPAPDPSGTPLPGYEVAVLTVAKYMRRASHSPSPTWRAFLAAHRHDIAVIDFFVVPYPGVSLPLRLRDPPPRSPRTPPHPRHRPAHWRVASSHLARPGRIPSPNAPSARFAANASIRPCAQRTPPASLASLLPPVL